MSPADYQRERKLRGTQAEVAAALDIQRETLSRRETGDQPISREAELALSALPKADRKRRRLRCKRHLKFKVAHYLGEYSNSARVSVGP